MKHLPWSNREKAAAKRAFEAALRKEYEALARKMKEIASEVKEPKDIWGIHDFLTEKRKEMDRKYDCRYSRLILVFASLMKDGWLKEEDLHGLQEEKIERIKSLASGVAYGSNDDEPGEFSGTKLIPRT